MTNARKPPAHAPCAPLTNAEVERYARQIVIPGLGAGGQARLLASTVVIMGEAQATLFARLYARAAGLRVGDDTAAASCIVVLGRERLADPELASAAEAHVPIVWCGFEAEGFAGGVACGREELACVRRHPSIATAPAPDQGNALRAAAGCDAVARAIGVLLGWPQALSTAEARLA